MKRAARKISPGSFVNSFLLAASEGEPTLREVASNVGIHGEGTVSKEALRQRIGPEAVELFKEVLSRIVAEALAPVAKVKIPGVARILLHDSSVIPLHRSLAGIFPCSINQNGKLSAGLRLQAVFDLVRGGVLSLAIGGYRERNDQAASGDILPFLQRGDLVVRDLGYLVAGVLCEIAGKGCFFLSRHINQRAVFDRKSGKKFELARKLRVLAPQPGDIAELEVEVGSGQHGARPIECRLVARSLPESVVNKRRREAKKAAKKHSKNGYTKRHMELLGWEIYLTNLDAKQADAGTVIRTYRLRWRVENLFKALKSNTRGLRLAKHRSNPDHVRVLVLAWLCLVVMVAATGYFAVAGTNTGSNAEGNEVSALKAVSRIFKLIAYSIFLSAVGTIGAAFERIERQIQYHDKYEKRRKRRNLPAFAKEILGLS